MTKSRKLIFIILTLLSVVCFSLAVANAFFAFLSNKNTKTEVLTVEALSGSGTKDDPYLIFNKDDLQQMTAVYFATNGAESYFKLMSDLYLYSSDYFKDVSYSGRWTGTTYGLPICAEGYSCYGGFDGNGHTIYYQNIVLGDMSKNGTPLDDHGITDIGGLFSTVSNFTLKNLKVEGNITFQDHRIAPKHYIGGVIGTVINSSTLGPNPDFNSYIENCYFDINVTVKDSDTYDGADPDPFGVGGVVGWSATYKDAYLYITNTCYVGEIYVGGWLKKSSHYTVGSIVRYEQNYDVIYTNCYYNATYTIQQRYKDGVAYDDNAYEETGSLTDNIISNHTSNFDEAKNSSYYVWYKNTFFNDGHPMQPMFIEATLVNIQTDPTGFGVGAFWARGGLANNYMYDTSTQTIYARDYDGTLHTFRVHVSDGYVYNAITASGAKEKTITVYFIAMYKIQVVIPNSEMATYDYTTNTTGWLDRDTRIATSYSKSANTYTLTVGENKFVINVKLPFEMVGWYLGTAEESASVKLSLSQTVSIANIKSENSPQTLVFYPIIKYKEYGSIWQ